MNGAAPQWQAKHKAYRCGMAFPFKKTCKLTKTKKIGTQKEAVSTPECLSATPAPLSESDSLQITFRDCCECKQAFWHGCKVYTFDKCY